MYFSENLTLPHWIKASHEKRLYSESIIFFSVYKLQKVLECLSEASVIFILLASPPQKTNKQTERMLAGTPQQLWPITAGHSVLHLPWTSARPEFPRSSS